MGGTHIDDFTRYGLLVFMVVVLAACVQPFEPTPVPPPTQASTPTPLPPIPTVEAGGVIFPPDVVVTWFQQNLGVAVTGLNLFTGFEVGPDYVIGFAFQDATAQNCTGFALTTLATASIWNGDYRCAAPGTQVIVGTLLFALTNNEFYVATYGTVDPGTMPGAGGVAITYPDGSSSNQFLSSNGFVMLRQGLELPVRLLVIGTNEATLADIPLQ